MNYSKSATTSLTNPQFCRTKDNPNDSSASQSWVHTVSWIIKQNF